MNKDCWCHHLLHLSIATDKQKTWNKHQQTTTNNNKQSIQYAQLFDVLLRRFVLRPLFELRTARFQHRALAQLPEVHFMRTPEEQGKKGDDGDATRDSVRPDAASADMPHVRTNATECAQKRNLAFFKVLMANCQVFTAFAMSGHESDNPASEQVPLPRTNQDNQHKAMLSK